MKEDFKAYKTPDNILLIGLTEKIKGFEFEIIWQYGQNGTIRGMHSTIRKYEWHPKIVLEMALSVALTGRKEECEEISREELKNKLTDEFRILIGKKAVNTELRQFAGV